MFGNIDPLTGDKQILGMSFGGIKSLKMCCLNLAAETPLLAVGQQMQCPYCFNTITTKARTEEVWGPKSDPITNNPRQLADNYGVALALYEKPLWYDANIEEDIKKRGLQQGVTESHRNTYNIAVRPLSWFEKDSICVVVPTDVSGIKLFVGRLKEKFREKTPEPADLQGVFV